MNIYLVLFLAIAFEVAGTMLLPTTKEFSKLVPSSLVSIFYFFSFYFLSISVTKLPLSIVYASWAGLGVFSVAILSYVFYKQTLNIPTIIGLFLIVIGVILVNMFKTD
jgi:small multidrug resistance pump